MTFSINTFKAQGLVYGGARQSLFTIEFPGEFPTSGAASAENVAKKISFLGMAASLPPSSVDYIDIPYMSRKIKVNGDRTFPDWVMTVMNDEDFLVRRGLEGWHQFINARQENRQNVDGSGKVEAYKRDIKVHQYGKTGVASGRTDSNGNGQVPAGSTDAQPIYSYTLVGAFPTAVDPISLDWNAINQVEQFDVTFTYDYWEPYVISAGSARTPQITTNPGINS